MKIKNDKIISQGTVTEKDDVSKNVLVFFVNGQKIVEKEPDPEMTLLVYLRTKLRLPGTKLACGEGGCGACTIMVSKYNPITDKIDHYSVNACLAPLCSFHGVAVTTVEGISTKDNGYLHPVQERLAKFHGSQCGFCTPGIVMSMYTLLRNNPEPTAWEMESYFDGNLCRCTGYRPILDAFQTFTKEFKCAMGDQCCKSQQSNGDRDHVDELNLNQSFHQKMALGLKTYDPTQEIIFPAELKVRHNEYHSQSLTFQGSNVKWIQPQTLTQLLQLKSENPGAKLICGNTEIGIETKFKNQHYPVQIYCSNVQELCEVKVVSDGVNVGAFVTLSQMDVELKKIIKIQPEYKTRGLAAFVEMLKWFASHQIRNVASLSGNIMTASPISDINPLLVAAGAIAYVRSSDRGGRSILIDKNFFRGYRKTAVADDEILESVTIPFTKENEYFQGYKQANRKDDDIALVNAGMRVVLSEDYNIQNICIAFGGMGVTVITATNTCNAVIGNHWDNSLISKVCRRLVDDLPLPPGSPGGVARFRKTVALSFFFKFFISVNSQRSVLLDSRDESAIEPLIHQTSEGIQVYGAKDFRERTVQGVLGNPLPHLAGLQHCKGEAMYVDDMPLTDGELHMSLVTSSQASAKILKIDFSAAEKAEGFQEFVSAADIEEQRNSLDIYMDTVFASDGVTCQGQVIGAVLADTHDHARRAAKMVNVDYEAKTPIISIKDAIRHNSYHGDPKQMEFGDLDTGFKSCDHILEGEFQINGQNHFYLETISTRAIPLENGEMEVFCCTQNPSEVQTLIASTLGVSLNKILVRTKRLGGGFGGKETQMLLSAIPTAVAARKTARTVRCVLDRDEDMTTTGNRHPVLAIYKVGFTSKGKILALDLQFYSNGGNSMDLSANVMFKTFMQAFMCYYIPNLRIVGKICKTNIMSNTAFRGFGTPQSHLAMEDILENVADFLNIRPELIKEHNFYQPEDPSRLATSHQGDILQNCWNLCIKKSDYQRRRQEVDAYNRANRWKKKGIAISPMRYGLGFQRKKMNQGGALVLVYHDGSVLIANGGVEMGQGLYVKMAQIASEVLEIPISYVQINETSTGTVPNTSPTASSVGTDLNGMAVKNACEILKQRLLPFKEENPKGTWEDWVHAALDDRVSLSATGYYKVPDVGGFDSNTGEEYPYPYFTLGAACSEIHIDCLTGDHKVLRTDIVMDIGQSINPAIDVGQIQGAFTQGYGLYMLEEVKVTPAGFHLTQGPGTYKIPSFSNIPTQFNVYIVPDSHNPFAVFGSKGVGEPPLLLASSIFYAAKDAIKSARKDGGKNGVFQLSSPAMPANIRMACLDQFTDYFPEEIPGTFKPWFVDL